jgi:hypothetical protein
MLLSEEPRLNLRQIASVGDRRLQTFLVRALLGRLSGTPVLCRACGAETGERTGPTHLLQCGGGDFDALIAEGNLYQGAVVALEAVRRCCGWDPHNLAEAVTRCFAGDGRLRPSHVHAPVPLAADQAERQNARALLAFQTSRQTEAAIVEALFANSEFAEALRNLVMRNAFTAA